MTRAYIVVGAESSGTRALTRAFVAAGCLGTDGHQQPLDHGLPPAMLPIVWRRSYPHAHRWPDLVGMLGRARDAGYAPHVIWIVRDMYPCVQSQVRMGHAADETDGKNAMREALLRIAADIERGGVTYDMVTYAGLVARPAEVLGWLMGRLGLPTPSMDIFDADEKWWTDEQIHLSA